MVRKGNGKKQPQGSGNGGTTVLDYNAPGERVRAGNTMKAADLETGRVSQEIQRLVEASRQGRLDERGKLDQFQGIHQDMVRGINEMLDAIDRKSTRLNSSHLVISYAVFCLKK